MNIGDYVRVENDKGMIEGTVTSNPDDDYFYVSTAIGALFISRVRKIKITILKTAEPKELGTVVSVILKADNRRYTAVRAEPKDYESKYAWYTPNSPRGTGTWHAWDEFKDVEYV